MKTIFVISLAIISLSLLSGCGEEHQEKKSETFKNPVNSYMDSRLDALQNAKTAVNKNNARTKTQDEAIKSLVK